MVELFEVAVSCLLLVLVTKLQRKRVGEAVAPLTQVQVEVGKERSQKISNNLSELKNVKPRVVSRSHEPQSIAANQR